MAYDITPSKKTKLTYKKALLDAEFKLEMLNTCLDNDDQMDHKRFFAEASWYEFNDNVAIVGLATIYHGYLLGKYGSEKYKELES